jgi:hypothetical protein
LSASGGRIAVWPKAEATRRPVIALRLALYKLFLEYVLERSANRASFDLVLDVADVPQNSQKVPVFSFHKHVASRNLLVPDVDFLRFNWYARYRDPLAYKDKRISAVFVGASSGAGLLSRDAIQRRVAPRFRVAEYFHGHPDVLFRITNAVQCESRDVEAYLKQQPWFGPRLSWRRQVEHRFLISMDGNGAAWSRVAKALASKGVLLNFDSPFQLYYFPALKAGREYLSVGSEADIEPYLERERTNPGTFRPVAQAGTEFARRYLNRASAVDYTALLLQRYMELL